MHTLPRLSPCLSLTHTHTNVSPLLSKMQTEYKENKSLFPISGRAGVKGSSFNPWQSAGPPSTLLLSEMSAFALGREAAPATLRAQLVWGCGEGWAAWLPMLAKVQASLSGADPSGKERMVSLLSIYKPDRGKSGGQSMGQSQQKLRFV